MLQATPTCAPCMTCANAQILVPSPTCSLSQRALGWTKPLGVSDAISCAPILGSRERAGLSLTFAGLPIQKSARLLSFETRRGLGIRPSALQVLGYSAPTRPASAQAEEASASPPDLRRGRLPFPRVLPGRGLPLSGWLRPTDAIGMIPFHREVLRSTVLFALERTSFEISASQKASSARPDSPVAWKRRPSAPLAQPRAALASKGLPRRQGKRKPTGDRYRATSGSNSERAPDC